MTNLEIVTYYQNLLILQYLQQPKAVATIGAWVSPVIMDQLPIALRDAFSVDFAEGAQLDIIGKYAGVSRNQYDFAGPVSLSDDDFRSLIRLKIIQNSSGSSLAEIQSLLSMWFPNQIIVFDYQNMQMDYFIDTSVGSLELAQVFVTGGYLPKPMAVALKATIYAPLTTRFFGFRTYDLPAFNVSPLNTYDSYLMDRPFLSYSYGVLP